MVVCVRLHFYYVAVVAGDYKTKSWCWWCTSWWLRIFLTKHEIDQAQAECNPRQFRLAPVQSIIVLRSGGRRSVLEILNWLYFPFIVLIVIKDIFSILISRRQRSLIPPPNTYRILNLNLEPPLSQTEIEFGDNFLKFQLMVDGSVETIFTKQWWYLFSLWHSENKKSLIK